MHINCPHCQKPVEVVAEIFPNEIPALTAAVPLARRIFPRLPTKALKRQRSRRFLLHVLAATGWSAGSVVAALGPSIWDMMSRWTGRWQSRCRAPNS